MRPTAAFLPVREASSSIFSSRRRAEATGKEPADYDMPNPRTRYNRVATPNRRPGEVIDQRTVGEEMIWTPPPLTRAVSGTRKRQIHTVDHFTSSGTVGHEQHVRRTSQQHEDDSKLGVGHGKRAIHLNDHFDTQGTCQDKTAPIQECLDENEAEVRGAFQTIHERGLGHQKGFSRNDRDLRSHIQNLGTMEPDWMRRGVRKPLFE